MTSKNKERTMAFELGGRADKFGNRYERRYFVSLMAKVLQGGLLSVQSEPTGDDESGTDIIVEYQGGRKDFHQCKARNGSNEHWTMSALARHKVFQHIKEHVKTEQNHFVFVTALPFVALNDLCLAARNSDSCQRFVTNQLTTHGRKNLFDQWRKNLGLGETAADQEQAAFYLRQFEICTLSDDSVEGDQWKYVLGSMFTGNPDDVYDVLLNLTENDNYGKTLTAGILQQYLEQRGYQRRLLAADTNIPLQIERLNHRFKAHFRPIGDHPFPIQEAHMALRAILTGKNVLLLGEAGIGKSGCVQALLAELDKRHIPYLALSVDQKVPQGTPEYYGEALGFKASPVLCLESQLASGQMGVLILDQLDSLRWATRSCEEALDVCGEMLRQVQALSYSGDRAVRVVLVSRKFDYENDLALRRLCTLATPEQSDPWEQIKLHAWDEERVEIFVGKERYARMLPAMKRILRTPCYLYIWQFLEDARKDNAFTTPVDLMKEWKTQIIQHGEQKNIHADAIESFLNALLSLMQETPCVPEMALPGNQQVQEFLISENVLYRNEGCLAFVHQSMADYLNVECWLQDILHRKKVEELLPSYNAQGPEYRVRLQMLWQVLLRAGTTLFLDRAESFLASKNIRYYYKCTVWEALGQIEAPGEKIMAFIQAHWNEDVWRATILHRVFWGHSAFIRQYVAAGFVASWTDPTALWLLRPLVTSDQAFVREAVLPCIGKTPENDQNILRLFWMHKNLERQTVELCLQILKTQPTLGLNTSEYESWVETCPDKAVEYLALVFGQTLSHQEYIAPKFMELSQKRPKGVLETLCPLVIEASKGEEVWMQWRAYNRHYDGVRCYVKLIQDSLQQLVQQDLPYVENFVVNHLHTVSWLEHEWILKTLLLLPERDATLAYQWLMEQFPEHFLDTTSPEERMMTYAAEVLKKFSPFWSDAQFDQMEQRVVSYHSPDMLENARDRFSLKAYWPYWGSLQEALLPAMDPARSKSKALQAVLQRRKEQGFGDVWYKKGGLIESYTVRSSIADHTEKLSDAAWIRLLTSDMLHLSPRDTIQQHFHRPGLESSPREFARTLENFFVTEPLRLAGIAEKLPEQIDAHYSAAILNVFAKKEVFDAVGFETVEAIAEKFTRCMTAEMDYELASGFCGLLINHPEAPWSAESYQRLRFLAVEHKNPQENTYNITSCNDPQNKSCQCLRDNVLNSIRGYAFRTIAETLWKCPEKVADWKTVLEHGLQDPHPSVRYAVIDALAAVSRVDKPFACEGYWEVLQQDPRCILHYTSGWFIMQLYPVHPEECRACLIWAFEQSETEQDLVRNAAHILAELCIKGDLDVHAYLFQRQYMPEQAYGILNQCFDDLNQEPKNTAAKRLLLYTLQNCQEIPQHIVWQYCREPGPHDPDVLRLFVERCANRAEYALIHFFLESRKENSPAWWENLYTFCARACADATKRYGLAVDDFCKLPFLLLETAATVQQREKALDVFDETFRSNVIQMENFLRETNR